MHVVINYKIMSKNKLVEKNIFSISDKVIGSYYFMVTIIDTRLCSDSSYSMKTIICSYIK